MADEAEGADQAGAEDTVEPKETKTFTQDELNAIVEQRLKRERAKYGDYEDLKAKASKFDEAEEAQKSELQKLTEKYQQTDSELNSLRHSNLILKACAENNIPASYSDLVHGDTEDEINEVAKKVAKLVRPEAGADTGEQPIVPGVGRTPAGKGSVPLKDQIAAAEKNGDMQTAMTLKAMMLQSAVK